jgi:TRAP-type uncharacterized transport system fused permease subunit
MFLFMFSAVAGLTPPVAITSYTAAGIAKADPNAVSIQGFLYGLPGFIIPFIFVMSPELLMVGSPWQVGTAILTAFFGICCLVAAIEGYFLGHWHPALRVLLFGAALLLLKPGYVSDLSAVGLVAACFVLRVFLPKPMPRESKAAA